MTYQPNQTTTQVSLLKLSWTSNLAQDDYLTLNSSVAGISGQSVSGSTITLPAGHYLFEAGVGADRTDYADRLEYRFEVDGSLVGTTGAMDCLSTSFTSFNVDQAGATHSALASFNLKVKAVVCTANVWTAQSDYSYLLITRVSE